LCAFPENPLCSGMPHRVNFYMHHASKGWE
jgi:hypothetical protein